jgi:LuxR family maltose regulon positive regulatory protein
MNFDKLLVATKFAPPRIGARFIVRKQLLEYLHETRRSTVTLVTGSAGFGKTTLLSQWRQELLKFGAEVVWLSLSRDDKELLSFCGYLLGALTRLGIPVNDDVLLGGDRKRSIDTLAALVIHEAGNAGKELYLIVDDYHYVEDPLAHRLMQKLLDYAPPNLHIVIASRVTPPLSVSRLRVMDQVAEVDCAELPFGIEEAKVFFEQNLGTIKLTANELSTIHDLTNGWPASLQLIAIMLRTRPESRCTLRDLAWKSDDLQDYLAEVVVAHLSPELSDFMEKISVCRRFNMDLAAFLTGNGRAAEMIKRIEEENLLIYRVESDDICPWYRFHPLFAKFLAARMARRGKPCVEEIHRRASQWFANHGYPVESVRHANLGGDLEFAVKAIEQATAATWSLGFVSPFLHLLERIPQETLFAHPKLFFGGCLAYAMSARPAKAERWLEQIRKSNAATIPAISSKLAVVDAAIAYANDDTKRVINLLEPVYEVSRDNQFLRYFYLATLALSYISVGRYNDFTKLLEDNPVASQDGDNDLAFFVEGMRCLLCLKEGKVKEAARLGSIQLTRSETVFGRRSAISNIVASTLSNAYYELDHLDEARGVIANRAGLFEAVPEAMVLAALCQARLTWLQESPDAALEFIESQAAHFRSLGMDRPYAYMLAEHVRILALKASDARAEVSGAKLAELALTYRDAEGSRAEIPMIAALTQSRLALVNGNLNDALEALSQVRQFVNRSGPAPLLVTVNLLTGVALDSLGLKDKTLGQASRKYLVDALKSGARLGLVRTFLDEGPRVEELLAHIRNDDTSLDNLTSQYLDDILKRFPATRPTPAVPPPYKTGPYRRKTNDPITSRVRNSEAGCASDAEQTNRVHAQSHHWNGEMVHAKYPDEARGFEPI